MHLQAPAHNGTNGAATIVEERKLRVCPEVMMGIVIIMIIIMMNTMKMITMITIIMVIMTLIIMFLCSSQLERYMMIIVMFIIIHES